MRAGTAIVSLVTSPRCLPRGCCCTVSENIAEISDMDRLSPTSDASDQALSASSSPRLPHCLSRARDAPRVGFLSMGRHPSFAVFTEALRNHGYIEGRDVILEPRFARSVSPSSSTHWQAISSGAEPT